MDAANIPDMHNTKWSNTVNVNLNFDTSQASMQTADGYIYIQSMHWCKYVCYPY